MADNGRGPAASASGGQAAGGTVGGDTAEPVRAPRAQPLPKSRSQSTRDRVLAVAVEQLQDGGEAAVRIDEIRDRSGVSIGSIYHHFGDRDGVIAAAQLDRFSRYAEAEIAALSEIVIGSRDLAQFRHSIRQLTRRSQSQLRTGIRWGRIGVLASTIGRPGLAAEVRAVQTRLTDGFQAHVAQGQARGFFRSDLDARAVAAFIEAYTLGAVLNDLDLRGAGEEAWERVVWSVLEGLLVDG